MTTYTAASKIAKVVGILALLSAPTVLLPPSCVEVAPPPAPASGIFAQDVSCQAIAPAGATIRPPAPPYHRQRRQGNHSHATFPPVNVASAGGSISHPPTSNCRRPPTVAVAAEDEERPSKRAKVNIAGLVDPPAIRNAISDLLEAAATIPVDPRFDLESGKTLEDMSIRPEGKEIVYVAALDLPYMFLPSLRMAGILMGGNLEVADTCVRLGAAKIGHSGNWTRFLSKMQRLQTHISFARIRWMAILINGNSTEGEQALHWAYRRFHIAGEWYRLTPARVAEVRQRARRHDPTCHFVYGRSHFPDLQTVWTVGTPPEHGHVYMAWYDWSPAVRDAIIQVHTFTADPNVKVVSSAMNASKIGSTVDISYDGRGHHYIWANCFAPVRHHSMEHASMLHQEQLLHDDFLPLWTANGEWFSLWEEDRDDISGRFLFEGIHGIHFGVWQRVGLNWHLTIFDIFAWEAAGWVDLWDLFINYFSGHFTVSVNWELWDTFLA